MEYETWIARRQSSTARERLLSAVGPVLWIAMSYVDPGKWAASVEGGARFGFDLALLLLIVNFTAILCQYLSALIAIATGRNLSQICRQEYDEVTCMLLGIQAEISMIVLDLTMVLGTAYGLNAVFGIDLLNCVFLTGFDAVLFPFFNSLLENPKAKTISVCLACFILATYVSGPLISQPESSLSVSGILDKLTGENAYALMSILGANIMPHNFYLHSSIVQQTRGQIIVAKVALCRDLFLATFCIFSGIFLVNCVLMNLAANVFYTSGLTSLTLQDALSLLDQGFRSSISSVPLMFIIFFANQLIAVTWSLEREVIARDFFGLEIPGWLHRTTIRIIAIIPALCCVLNSGAEGIFQFLIFAQVLVALLLPSSVIPLFRVASSRSIMGVYKISHTLEFLALAVFVGMSGVNIFFVIELLFGSSDWVTSLKWNMGSNVPISYVILLVSAFTSLRLMVWLATTPLKSARSVLDMNALKWGKRNTLAKSLSIKRDEPETSRGQHPLTKAVENHELYAPESRKVNKSGSLGHGSQIIGLKVEGGEQIEKDEEELTKDVAKSCQPIASDGPESFKSFGGKSDSVDSGTGSLSKLEGLGRAARQQVTAILDEFWGQVFNFHGQVAQGAKARKLDVLLGIDTTVTSTEVESFCKESNEYFPSANVEGPDPLRTSTFFNGSMSSFTRLPLGAHLGSSMRPTYMQLLDSYVRNSSYHVVNSSERRYHSARILSSSGVCNQQPATIHGYNMASYLIQVAKEKAQLESLTLASTESINSLVQKPQNGLHVPRNSSLKSERYFNNPNSPKPINYINNQPNVKKFLSLPDVYGLYTPLRSSFSNSSSHQDVSMGYKQFLGCPVLVCRDGFSLQFSSNSGARSLWSMQPREQFGVAEKTLKTQKAASNMNMEAKLLQSFRSCIMKLLKLEGSNWLFRQNDGADEDLIHRVAARERLIYEVETMAAKRKFGLAIKNYELGYSKSVSTPNCGDGCVWCVDIIISFGVWCIYRILELSLVESRPELWGKYTYVLNRLQGIINPAFSKPRSPLTPCFCLQLPTACLQKSSSPISNSSGGSGLPPPAKPGQGKFTTSEKLLDMIKEIESAISSRSDTAAGDMAFTKGKEKLASVMKRYSRHLSNKPVA